MNSAEQTKYDGDLARTLFEDAGHWRKQTHWYKQMRARLPIRDPGFTDARRTLLLTFIAWCRKVEVEPRYFLYVLYQAREWRFPVKFEHYCSDQVLKRYTAGHFNDRAEAFRQYLVLRPASTRDPAVGMPARRAAYDPNIDISSNIEARKRTLAAAGLPLTCMEQTADHESPTYGYHPKSRICLSCSVSSACAEKLRKMFSFDLVSVRQGSMSMEQAEIIAANVRNPH